MTLSPLYSSSAFGVTSPDSLTLLINLEESTFGPTPPDVASAVCHLCRFLEGDATLKPIPLDDYYQVAKDYYDRFVREDPSGVKSLTLICYVSAYFHELRHVHDLISTKYGQEVLFKNLNYYQNVPALVTELVDWQERNPSRQINLPLGSHLSEMEGLRDDVRKLVRLYPKLHRAIDELHSPGQGFHNRLTVRHLLECSATNAQIYFVNDVFGEEAYNRLIEFISEGTATPEYWQINSDMIEAFVAKGFHGGGLGKLINYLAWCALFGATKPGGKAADGVSIVICYEALVEHVLHHIQEVDFETVRAWVDDFCNGWGLETPAQKVQTTRESLKEQSARFETAWQNLGAASKVGAPLTASYKQIVRSFSDLNDLIAKHPDQYFGNYGWLVLSGRLPSAYVFIKREGQLLQGVSAGTELLPVDDWGYIAHMATTLRVLLDGPNPDSPFSFLEQESLSNLRTYAPGGVALRL